MADEGTNPDPIAVPIRGVTMGISHDLWPNHRTGITLLVTQMADRFFSKATPEAPAPPVAGVVRCLPTGELRQAVFGPDVERVTPEATLALAAGFAATMADEGVIAGFHIMEGFFFAIEDGAPKKVSHHPALIACLYMADEGFIESRVIQFERNAEGVPIQVGRVEVSNRPQSFGPILDGILEAIGKEKE